MAMTPRLWSLSALAVEFARDRRTVAASLSSVPPDGLLNGKPAWRLTSALSVLGGKLHAARTPPPEAPDVPFLRGVENPFDAGALWAAVTFSQEVGPLGAVMAAACNIPMAKAYALKRAIEVAFVMAATDLFRRHRIGPFADDESDPEIWPFEPDRVNWTWLAEKAGEKVDIEEWSRLALDMPIHAPADASPP